ncbi:MAG: hypothetical protein WAU47_04420, partial [Desulfobaccales bacterium]
MTKWLRLLLGLCLAAWWLVVSPPVWATPPNPIKLYLFSAKGCQHCLEAKKFLMKLEGKYPHLQVVEMELTESRANQEVFKQVAARLQADLPGVPCMVIGSAHFVGWQGEHSTGAALEKLIREWSKGPPPLDLVAPLRLPETLQLGQEPPQIPETLNFPIIGAVETRHFSLGLLTVIIGALDGFNPCAMWALVFLISLLLGMENRTRMWVLGSLFIGGSGLVYFFFMTAWLNILLFLGLVVWIRVAIGGIALVVAGINFREYFLNKAGACNLLGGERRQGLMARIKGAIEHQSFLLAALGIFLLGVAVNLVELFCSAGLPVVYTQILTMSRLPLWQYYVYLALYIFVFMLDDLIVFVVSMLTLQHFGLAHKYK